MNSSYLKQYNRSRYLCMEEEQLYKKPMLKLREFANATVLPGKRNREYVFAKGGVVDAKGQLIEESQNYTRAGRLHSNPDNEYEVYFGGGYAYQQEDADYLDEDVIYLGYLAGHWGHFLTDCTTRLWYALECQQNLKLCFAVCENEKFQPSDSILEFFQYLGLSDRIVYLNKITRFRKVLIPEPSYVANSYYSEQFTKVFDRVAAQAEQNPKMEAAQMPKKVYFTRRMLKKAKRTESGEDIFIKLFQKNGYAIIAPEQFRLREQIHMLRAASEIVCMAGTIPHNMLFAKEGQHITILNKASILNVVQRDIGFIRHLHTVYVDSYLALRPVGIGDGPFCMVYNDVVRQYVRDSGLEGLKESEIIGHQRRTIKKYIQNLRLSDKPEITEYFTDTDSHAYFDSENYNEFMEHYYQMVYPLTVWESFRKRWRDR